MAALYTVTLVFHVIGFIIAVGSATIVDYLHLVGLRKKSLERGMVKIYPYISHFINISLVVIYASGIFLIIQNPSLLQSSLFITKLVLVVIVTINGIYLQKVVTPMLDICILKGTQHCTTKVLYTSAISGSISIVTWYSVLILSLTKNLGYSVSAFVTAYVIVLAGVVTISLLVEKNAKNWRDV